ncbi:hypothetical protein ACFL3P_02375 [Pseudomonadota bacterium]
MNTGIPVVQRIVSILWPSFITASVATIVFFSVFDPSIVFIDFDISRLGAYTIGFFTFWLFGVFNCVATCYFLKPCKVPEKKDADSAA